MYKRQDEEVDADFQNKMLAKIIPQIRKHIHLIKMMMVETLQKRRVKIRKVSLISGHQVQRSREKANISQPLQKKEMKQVVPEMRRIAKQK